MHRYLVLTLVLTLTLLGGATAQAAPILSGVVTLDGTEQLTSSSRVFRNAIASTWAAPKVFPGQAVCLSGPCYYETLMLDPSPYQDIRITFEWAAGGVADIFLVAYLGSFNVADLAANYLGDPGNSVLSSQPLRGPRSFEVIVPPGNNLVLAFSTVYGDSPGTVNYTVEGFSAVPEPASLLLFGTGLLGAAGRAWRRRQ